MEHYRSTLITTAFAVFGLVVAAHVLHPANFERVNQAARVVAVVAKASPQPAAWSDLPGELHSSEPGELMADSRTLLAHLPMVAVPSNERSVPRLSSMLVAPPIPIPTPKGDPIGDLIHHLDLDDG